MPYSVLYSALINAELGVSVMIQQHGKPFQMRYGLIFSSQSDFT